MTTHGDQVREFGGVPVGNNSYAGWWDNGIWFIDDIVGLDGNEGHNPQNGKKTIQAAIDLAGPNDVIFLRPRDMGTGRYHEHGYYSGTLTTTKEQAGLQIIGTGGGGRKSIGANIQCAIESDEAETDATINVQSPCVTIENVAVKRIDDSAGAIQAKSTFGVVQAWGLTISNCFFKDFSDDAGAVATINLFTTHWVTLQHLHFRECLDAISVFSHEAAVRNLVIRECTFTGAEGDIDCDIRIGDCKSLTIDKCKFPHSVGTGGAQNIYINMVGTAGTGMISNCQFSENSETITTFATLIGSVLLSNCRGSEDIIDG